MIELLQIPGVESACIADETGHLIESVGSAMPPSAAVLVLAHATMSAASELGRRSGVGDCLEITQHHEGGFIHLLGLAQRMTLLVRCLPGTDLRLVKQASASISPTPLAPLRRASVAAMDLGSALYAMPAW